MPINNINVLDNQSNYDSKHQLISEDDRESEKLKVHQDEELKEEKNDKVTESEQKFSHT